MGDRQTDRQIYLGSRVAHGNVIALQRWLGLPIHMASVANVTAAETLGDELLLGFTSNACSASGNG